MFRSEKGARDGDAHRRRNRWWNVNFFGSLVIVSGVFAVLEITLGGWSWQRSLLVTGSGMAFAISGWTILGSITEYLKRGEEE